MSKLEWLKGFIIFYGIITVLLIVDQWFLGILNQWYQSPRFSISYETLVQMGIMQRLAGVLISSISAGFFIGVLYCFYGIIGRVQNDQTFTKNTLNKISKATQFYLAYTIFYPFYEAAFSVITTLHTKSHVLSVSFGTENLNQILIASCLYVVFKIMQEAHQISAENELVI